MHAGCRLVYELAYRSECGTGDPGDHVEHVVLAKVQATQAIQFRAGQALRRFLVVSVTCAASAATAK